LFGAIFDSTCDRITEIVWIGGICAFYGTHTSYGPQGVYLCFAALSGSLMVSYVKARAEGAGIPCPGGILQRPERIIILAVAQLAGPVIMLWGLGLIAVVGYVTVFQRLLTVAAECRRRQS
jgi:CDP-diacylglycerol--glycerol-3-phosphate 3-phosphatidyltransferase